MVYYNRTENKASRQLAANRNGLSELLLKIIFYNFLMSIR